MRGPLYIRDFKCIASRCQHSCCIGWEIDIDSATLEKYKQCDKERGSRLCESICLGTAGEACFRMGDGGRCPQLASDGLCEIIKALGEEYLSDICREHPRFYHECDEEAEVGIGLCCEAAAELILTSDGWGELVPIASGEGDTDTDAGYASQRTAERRDNTLADCASAEGFSASRERERLYCLLGDRRKELDERLDELRKIAGIDEDRIRDKILSVLPALEYLDGEYESLLTLALRRGAGALYDEYGERALAYFIFRYVSPARDKEDMLSRLRLALGLEKMLSSILNMPTIVDKYGVFECARKLSEEIEYNEDNIDILRFALDG
ncbi:MAG: flagellin lysine-N-methylase [Clostridia bacterium]|nr:flagellin lysine-N-methylase [Clostridia bacterium]